MNDLSYFDISSAKSLFGLIKIVSTSFFTSKEKRPEELFFLIFSLAHLREWIAPNYCHKNEAKSKGEVFFNTIFENPQYKIILSLCNHAKHLDIKHITKTEHNIPFDEWENIDKVHNFDLGPVSHYFVDEQDLNTIIQNVIDFYEQEWFFLSN